MAAVAQNGERASEVSSVSQKSGCRQIDWFRPKQQLYYTSSSTWLVDLNQKQPGIMGSLKDLLIAWIAQ